MLFSMAKIKFICQSVDQYVVKRDGVLAMDARRLEASLYTLAGRRMF